MGAEIVVVGAGVVGASVAYHLAAAGQERVTVADARARDLLPGSTGLAPGFVGQLSATTELAVLAMDGVATYRSLAPTAFRQVGCLEIATTQARLEQAHADVEHGRGLGIEAQVLDADTAVALAPALVNAERALGALYIPSDGAAEPIALTEALVAAAVAYGVTFQWGTRVRALETAHGRVVGVRTDDEVLPARAVVLAAGIWGPALAASAGVRLPMVAVQHPYVRTTELPDLDDTPIDAPIVRYPDHAVYTRRHGRHYGLGTYSHDPIPLVAAAETAERPYRETDFGAAIAAATALVPTFRTAGVGSRLNGAFALTPDELPLVGPVPDLPGLWVAEASWVTHAGGVGRHLANLLLDTGDLAVDPARLAPDRFAQWSDERVYATALGHYRGIYDAH